MSVETSQLENLNNKIKDLQKKLKLESLKQEVVKLEKDSTAPDLWKNETNARSVLQNSLKLSKPLKTLLIWRSLSLIFRISFPFKRKLMTPLSLLKLRNYTNNSYLKSKN